MSTVQHTGEPATHAPRGATTDMKLEVVVIPVSHVDRAKAFYASLDWRLDADFADGEGFRIVQFKPPGFGSFSDPDGNSWLLQEITTRLPGRIDSGLTTFGSVDELASAMRRASVAHGDHEKRTGGYDEDWPGWYAAFIAAEQAETELPV